MFHLHPPRCHINVLELIIQNIRIACKVSCQSFSKVQLAAELDNRWPLRNQTQKGDLLCMYMLIREYYFGDTLKILDLTQSPGDSSKQEKLSQLDSLSKANRTTFNQLKISQKCKINHIYHLEQLLSFKNKTKQTKNPQAMHTKLFLNVSYNSFQVVQFLKIGGFQFYTLFLRKELPADSFLNNSFLKKTQKTVFLLFTLQGINN